MRYEEFEPAPRLNQFVSCYLSFTVPAHEPTPIHHLVVPDGSVSLVYIRLPHTPRTLFQLVGPRLEALQPPTVPGGFTGGFVCSRAWRDRSSTLLSFRGAIR